MDVGQSYLTQRHLAYPFDYAGRKTSGGRSQQLECWARFDFLFRLSEFAATPPEVEGKQAWSVQLRGPEEAIKAA